jgi:RNA recognition motif-containing protein
MNGYNLTKLFSNYGRVSANRVTINRLSSNGLGNAYIEMDFPSEAQKAIDELNGSEIDGQKIGVSMAVKK